MSRPAVFFDRDNTLIVNSEYLGDPDQVELIPGAPDAVARARALGFAIVIVSNQSGVARGMFTEEDVRAVNDRMDAMLLEENPNAIVDRHEYCATHPQGTVKAYCLDDDRRKPRPGMIRDAARAMDLDVKRSWLIGDAPRDIAAGHAAGCRTILLRETFRTASPAASESAAVEADYVASSLLDAIDFIEMNLEPAARGPLITPPPSARPAADASPASESSVPESVVPESIVAASPGVAANPGAPAEAFDPEPAQGLVHETDEIDETAPASSADDEIVDAGPMPGHATARPDEAASIAPFQRTAAEIAAAEAASAAQIASVFAGGPPKVHVGTQPHTDAPPRKSEGRGDWTSKNVEATPNLSGRDRDEPRRFIPPVPAFVPPSNVASPAPSYRSDAGRDDRGAARDDRGAAGDPRAAGRDDRETNLLLERVLDELRRANDPPQDFSIARMLGGLVQGFALAMFVAAIVRSDSPSFTMLLGVAIFLQLLVSSLYLMGR